MLGIDIVEINRIASLHHKEKFIQRILSAKEQVEYRQLSSEQRKNQWLAGRFAAKEAIIKAMDQQLFMRDIELVKQNNKLFFIVDNNKVVVSIAHEKHYAIASALVV